MTFYLPDTHVWAGVGKDSGITGKFEHARTSGDTFLIAPPALIELVRGMVRYGKDKFTDDQKTFSWMQSGRNTGIAQTLHGKNTPYTVGLFVGRHS